MEINKLYLKKRLRLKTVTKAKRWRELWKLRIEEQKKADARWKGSRKSKNKRTRKEERKEGEEKYKAKGN